MLRKSRERETHLQHCTTNKSDCKGTHTVQTHVVPGSAVFTNLEFMTVINSHLRFKTEDKNNHFHYYTD